ncbi:MAG: carbohydrate binding domain-containing protein [Bacteroidales bacterium]
MKKKIKFIASLLALLLSALMTNSFGQTPYVYSVENTGASCTAPVLPAPADLPSIIRLPNPFEFSNGQSFVNTLNDWSCRRNEIRSEIENYEIGFRPTRPANITASFKRDSVYQTKDLNYATIDFTDPEWYNNLTDTNYTIVNHTANFILVTIIENGKTLTLSSIVTIPAGTGPFPAVIGLSGATGSLPDSLFANCIKINFDPGQVAVDGQANTGAFYNMYGIQAGHYTAWTWGISRLIDGLELVQSQMNIDLAHIGITGCSRYGKLALFGGAFDERIALTIAQEPGGGGAAAWRVSETIGNVEKIDNTDYSWFLPAMRDNFKGRVAHLPHDHHELIAMIAPRAVLVLGNSTIDWLADPSGYVSCMAAREVWKKFGVEDRMGWDFTGGHDHCAAPASQIEAADAFIKRFLYSDNTVSTNILTSPYQDVDYQFWIKDWANVTEPAVLQQNFWYEPETTACGTLGSNFVAESDANASGGKYVTAGSGLSNVTEAPGEDGQLKITFDTDNNGEFYVALLANCPNGNSNAFWAKIDDDDFVLYDYLDTYGQWQWVALITGRPLPKGTHTLTIAYAKAGAKLDRILITNDPNAIPTSGFGGAETHCELPQKYSQLDFENGNISNWSKLNLGAGIDITQEDKHGGDYALKMVNGTSTSAWSVQVTTPDVEIHSEHIYTVSFWVRAVGGGGKGRISTAGNGALGGTYWSDFTVGNDWEQKTFTNLTANGSSVKLSFDMGYIADKTYYIDDIVFDDTDMTETGISNPIYSDWTGKIYSSEKGKIDVIAPNNSKVQIMDIFGREVGTRTANSSLQFSVNSAGIYIVSIKNGDKTYRQKLIVK